MKKNNNLKNRLKKFLSKSKLSYVYVFFYQCFTNWNGRQRFVRKNDTPCDIFVIRPRTNTVEGLMSLFLFVLKNIDYAVKNNYRFFIDFKNYQTQYFIEGENVWNLFFEQPSLDNDDFMDEHSYILSGFTFQNIKNKNSVVSPDVFFDTNLKNQAKALISSYIRISKVVQKEFDSISQLYPFISDSIGVYIRGTDYEKLKPSGENIQPQINDVINKINEFRLKYGKKKLYLVTEDFSKYEILKDYYGDDLFVINANNMITTYTGSDFLCNSNCLEDDRQKRGMEYLLKILLLTKCRYFISSITKGSIAAYLLKKGDYDDEFIFNLGIY